MSADIERDLLDDDGENRAVRSFLMQWGLPGLTVGAMSQHMARSGWGAQYCPDFVNSSTATGGEHLTKAGAQIWLRHLFGLEARATPSPAPIQQDAPPLGWRDDLQAIDRAMQHMGDALNGMDAVEAEDEEAVSGGFEAMERLLAANDWVLVPIRPTPKMVDATFNDRVENESHNARNKRIYAAMISAAPTVKASQSDTHPSATARNEKD